MTPGYHAPPPGAPTGVADYAETLRKALGPIPSGVPVYHLGNNRLHAEIYSLAIQRPGIAVIHDAVLHHFLLGTLSRERYIEEFVYNYGEWSRHVGEDLWNERAASAVDARYFRYPMLRRAVENQRAVIVHNPGAAAMVRDHGAQNVHIIHHFFEPEQIPDRAATERFRQRVSVEPGVTLFGIFGYLRETKRLLPCINTFRRLNAVRPDTALLIAGDAVSGDLSRLLASETNHPAIRRIGHLTDADLRIAAGAVDCCINLRYPAAGETSGIAIRLMGTGKPVILTEGAETAAIPSPAALRVPVGVEETCVLFDQMALIAGFPELARQIGREAADYIRTNHSLEKAVAQYRQVIESIRAIDVTPQIAVF